MPFPPLTATATEMDCAVVAVVGVGVTVRVGVISTGAVTVTDAVPEALE